MQFSIMALCKCQRMLIFLMFLSTLLSFLDPCFSQPMTRNYDFKVQLKNITKLCNTTTIVTVNGMFPGPTIYAQEDETVIIKVTNLVSYNVTLHWHGVKQKRSCWADGPRFIAQCPIQTGKSYTYKFTLTGQRGTFWWHAHIAWLRATVNGAIVIYPRTGVPYPFQHPSEEHVLVFGEWWNTDVANLESAILASGGGPPNSDAYLINGHPGPTYNCSTKDVWTMPVVKGKTYLMRIINAALNIEHFFSVAKHKITLVAVDGEYTKPRTVDYLKVDPGQTCDVLLRAYRGPSRDYYMGIGPYMSANISVNMNQTFAILSYMRNSTIPTSPTIRPRIPGVNDTQAVFNTLANMRSLNSQLYPTNVPQKVDRRFFFAIELNLEACKKGETCKGPNNSRFKASINNNTFHVPQVAILKAYYNNISGVFSTDFPSNPPSKFDFTGNINPVKNLQSNFGTKVLVLKYNQSVQIILQGTSLTSAENHPIHLHGHNFYVIGFGTGNYPGPTNFNLLDPPSRNTIGVPANGWVAIRFVADNPGVWYLHCHLEIHLTWGLSMAFLTLNGNGPNQTLLPPPSDYPQC